MADEQADKAFSFRIILEGFSVITATAFLVAYGIAEVTFWIWGVSFSSFSTFTDVANITLPLLIIFIITSSFAMLILRFVDTNRKSSINAFKIFLYVLYPIPIVTTIVYSRIFNSENILTHITWSILPTISIFMAIMYLSFRVEPKLENQNEAITYGYYQRKHDIETKTLIRVGYLIIFISFVIVYSGGVISQFTMLSNYVTTANGKKVRVIWVGERALIYANGKSAAVMLEPQNVTLEYVDARGLVKCLIVEGGRNASEYRFSLPYLADKVVSSCTAGNEDRLAALQVVPARRVALRRIVRLRMGVIEFPDDPFIVGQQ